MLVWEVKENSNRLIAIGPVLLAFLLACYLFLDGLLVLLSAAQLVLYALFALFAAAQATFALTQVSIEKQVANFLLAWLLATSVYLLPALASEYQYPRYIMTDLIASILPLLLLITALRFPDLLLSKRIVIAMALVSFAAASLSVTIAEQASRHEPPSTLLMAAAWAAFFVMPSARAKKVSAAGLIVLLILAIASGERTAALLWLFLGMAGWFLVALRLRGLIWISTLLAVVVAVTIFFFGESLLLAVASTRFESLAQGELDESLLSRVLEVRDTWSQWTLAQWYGFGHGATYLPDASYLSRNFTEHSRVHNIHFGPMLLLYRYGLPGLFLYFWLIVDVGRFAMALKAAGYDHEQGFVYLFFTLGLTGHLVSFLMFNIIPDPAFSYVLAGYLYIRLVRTAESRREPVVVR